MPEQAQQAILFNMIQIQLKLEDTPFHGPYFHVVGLGEKVTLALGTKCLRAGTVYQKTIFFPDLLSMVVGKGPSATSTHWYTDKLQVKDPIMFNKKGSTEGVAVWQEGVLLSHRYRILFFRKELF